MTSLQRPVDICVFHIIRFPFLDQKKPLLPEETTDNKDFRIQMINSSTHFTATVRHLLSNVPTKHTIRGEFVSAFLPFSSLSKYPNVLEKCD